MSIPEQLSLFPPVQLPLFPEIEPADNGESKPTLTDLAFKMSDESAYVILTSELSPTDTHGYTFYDPDTSRPIAAEGVQEALDYLIQRGDEALYPLQREGHLIGFGETSRGPSIIFADDSGIMSNQEGVEKILECLGHPGAFVTDESLVSDFLTLVPDLPESKAYDEAKLSALKDLIGRPVDESERIVDLAKLTQTTDYQ